MMGFISSLSSGLLNVWNVFWKYRGMFFAGAKWTLTVTFVGVLLGTLLGTVLAFMRLSKTRFLRWPAGAYIEFIRGTPLLVQVTFATFALPLLLPNVFGADDINTRASIVVGINSAAYVAEIIRSGIQAVDKGQTEASMSLGMNKLRTMILIILPQAIKNILPALANEFIVVIKESSIVSILGLPELMYMTNKITSTTFDFFTPLIIVSLIYFLMTFSLSKVLTKIEKNMDKSKQRTLARAIRNVDDGDAMEAK